MPTTDPTTQGRLAKSLQEAFTLIVRLRDQRLPVPDGAAFRAHVLQTLSRAEQEAQAAGFTAADIRVALFAVVAFLDESVLNAGLPTLNEWSRRPVQDELFGGHMGGEWFFQHLEQLLARPDGPELSDLLEVHQLCLLLGFRGKYGATDPGALHAIGERTAERITRLRGPVTEFAPAWTPPADDVQSRDPWIRPLTVAAIAGVLLAAGVWGTASFLLAGGRDDVRALAPSAAATAAR